MNHIAFLALCHKEFWLSARVTSSFLYRYQANIPLHKSVAHFTSLWIRLIP